MADLKRQRPDRPVHSIAAEVATEAHPHRNEITVESLTTKLERDYKSDRHRWRLLLESSPAPSRQQIAEDLRKRKSKGELRARVRIADALPSVIDVFDQVLAEADRRGDETLRLVKRLGRERVEAMLARAGERMRVNPYTLADPYWRGKIPEIFLDLIEPELENFRTTREPPR
jgi:hypothetical protein